MIGVPTPGCTTAYADTGAKPAAATAVHSATSQISFRIEHPPPPWWLPVIHLTRDQRCFGVTALSCVYFGHLDTKDAGWS
jgi:hypothetical protein